MMWHRIIRRVTIHLWITALGTGRWHLRWPPRAAGILLLICSAVLPAYAESQTPAPDSGTFTNPINPGPDPWMLFHEGHYYLTTTQGNCLRMWKAATLAALKTAQAVTVWTDDNPTRSHGIWAPEFHFINGHWYLYYTAMAATRVDTTHRMHVLESEGTDPLGPYHYKGRLFDPGNDFYAIDGSVFQHPGDGRWYFLWAGHPGHRIRISFMKNPWTLEGPSVVIPASGFGCEEVREGPVVLKRHGKLFLTYSACDTGKPDYKLGMLIADENADVMDPASWKQYSEPVFERNDPAGVFGPGHHGFFQSPDGTEDWIVYHGKTSSEYTYKGRTTRAQRFTWNADGTPNFGRPLSLDTVLTEPSSRVPAPQITNPVTPSGADPWVIRHDDQYYLCQSRRGGIWVNHFSRLQDIGQDHWKRVWTPPSNTDYSVPAWGPTKDVGVYEKYAEWYWWSKETPSRESYGQFNAFHERAFGKDVKYPDFVNGFKCEMFEPDQWARIFKNAGAKYVVLTSKHHEGFCLWPSQESWNWNAVDVGPHRDLAGDLITAVRGAGLNMGYYYSLYEWFNPLYREDVNQYVDQHMLPQMKDLVTRYKPDIVWTDGEWDHPSDVWRATEFLAWLYNDSPVKDKVVVNDRWGKETRGRHGGIWTTEYDLVHSGNADDLVMDRCWEECRGVGTSFGYNRNETLENYSTSEELVEILINKVARGGNLLLNVGPTADGRIPVIIQQRLSDMGQWLAINGEAIYGTRKWQNAPKVTPDTTIYFTAKGKDLYVICTEFPTQPIQVKGLGRSRSMNYVSMLGTDINIKASLTNKILSIEPPMITPANNPCNYAWVFKIAGAL